MSPSLTVDAFGITERVVLHCRESRRGCNSYILLRSNAVPRCQGQAVLKQDERECRKVVVGKIGTIVM
jgi:hypothetical protein